MGQRESGITSLQTEKHSGQSGAKSERVLCPSISSKYKEFCSDPLMYAYDGLYLVTDASEVFENNCRVITFKFEGIPGNHCVSARVINQNTSSLRMRRIVNYSFMFCDECWTVEFSEHKQCKKTQNCQNRTTRSVWIFRYRVSYYPSGKRTRNVLTKYIFLQCLITYCFDRKRKCSQF